MDRLRIGFEDSQAVRSAGLGWIDVDRRRRRSARKRSQRDPPVPACWSRYEFGILQSAHLSWSCSVSSFASQTAFTPFFVAVSLISWILLPPQLALIVPE